MTDYGYLRPRKASCGRELWNRYADRSGDLRCDAVSDCRLVPHGQRPGVVSGREMVVDDCDFCASLKPGNGAPYFDGISLYGGYLRSAWGHFLVNSTARLWPLFTDNPVEVDRVVFFAEKASDCPLHGNVREFFELAGILDKVVIMDRGASFGQLVVPEISLECDRYFSREFLTPFNRVRNAVECGDAAGPRRVFLSRARWKGGAKRQINIAEVERLFVANGYQAIHPESATLRELVGILSGASSMATYSGSAAHNILFAPPHTELVTVERTGANNMYQTAIARAMGNQWTPVDAFYQPQLSPSTDPLAIYSLTPWLKRFCDDRGFDNVLTDVRPRRRRELRSYMREYRRTYGYEQPVAPWEMSQIEGIAECLADSNDVYGRWLRRHSPLLWHDYLSPRVWKRVLSDFLSSKSVCTKD